MAKEPEKKKDAKEEAAPPVAAVAHPVFNKLGWIIFGVTHVIYLGVFGAVIFFIQKPPPPIPELQELPSSLSRKDLTIPPVEVQGKDSIIISIPTNINATEQRHLKLSFALTIGSLSDENIPNFDLVKAIADEGFLEVMHNMMPHIKDMAIQLLSGYTYLQLQDETAKNEFKERLREKVNEKLQRYSVKPRIKEVLIHEFIFSD